ncbi:hypothetical protein [Maridesulfovibrio sp. FT414]|uniref:hypothetical protein n=1 Tax=Maridesulfovibrio sp. FT414 TaxID=2979469 RepID=UPI003D805CE7
MNKNPYDVLADWLDGEARALCGMEAQAHKALYDDKDESAYRELMRQRAMRLADLAENCDPLVSGLAKKDRLAVEKRVGRFSSSASQSLEIGSVFYMSALLYPEDYVQGDKNDLEVFAVQVRSLK